MNIDCAIQIYLFDCLNNVIFEKIIAESPMMCVTIPEM